MKLLLVGIALVMSAACAARGEMVDPADFVNVGGGVESVSVMLVGEQCRVTIVLRNKTTFNYDVNRRLCASSQAAEAAAIRAALIQMQQAQAVKPAVVAGEPKK